MKGIICSLILFSGMLGAAEGQSLAYLMEEADLVVAGDVQQVGESTRFDLYTLGDLEVVRGVLEDPGFFVASFKDISIHHPALRSGSRMLLFLRRLPGSVVGLPATRPVCTVLSGEFAGVYLDADQEPLWMEAVYGYNRALMTGETGGLAKAVAKVFRDALEAGNRELLGAAAFDGIAVPGVLELLDEADQAGALDSFRAAPPMCGLKMQLLLLLGELSPPGFDREVESMVREPEGVFYLDMAAAILDHTADPATPARLIIDFEHLHPQGQENSIRVLGLLGQGKGVASLRSLIGEYHDSKGEAIVLALGEDRSDAAVEALELMVRTAGAGVAIQALDALAGINTAAARAVLESVARSEEIEEPVRAKAAAWMQELSS